MNIKPSWKIFLLLIICVVFAVVFFSLNSFSKMESNSFQPSADNKVLGENEKLKSEVKIVGEAVEAAKIKLLFVGDIMLDRSIGERIKNGEDPFQNVQKTFDHYDAVIGNLETSVGEKGERAAGKLFTFQSSPSSLSTLKKSGFKAVSLANNHTMDYGKFGLEQTLTSLDQSGVNYFGSGKNSEEAFSPFLLKIKDQQVAIIGMNDIETNYGNVTENDYGSAYFNLPKIQDSLNKIDSKIPVIAMPHWGMEYSLQSSLRQQNFANHLFNSGVDLIIGGHPHVVQNIDQVDGKTVYYSMGNFVFDGMGDMPNATKAQMIEVEIEDNQIVSTRPINVELDKKGFPRFVE
jgi:poly-gamma-glutamate capsule biosynthesis protein CapA/YwtB (metallophosphatase superfamily)